MSIQPITFTQIKRIYDNENDVKSNLNLLDQKVLNSWTIKNLNFFNDEFSKQSFNEKDSISLVLLFSDFNLDASNDAPIMAVLPKRKTYYRYLPSSDYKEKLIDNIDLQNSQIESDLYVPCTRFKTESLN